MQGYFLTAGITGFLNPLCFLAGGLFALRNFAGDLRDITKDRKENMKTLPVLLGVKKPIKHIHLIFVLLTTLVWWKISGISITWLITAYALSGVLPRESLIDLDLKCFCVKMIKKGNNLSIPKT
jgi:4-hydroxybenzoate polyprenyltransferase